MLSEEWWLERTSGEPTAPDFTWAITRWQLAQVAHDLVWRWHTPLGVVPFPSQPGEGFEPLVVASPQCLRSAASFALVDDQTMGWSTGVQIGDLPVPATEPGSPRSLSRLEARRAFFSALRLEDHLTAGHEKCFHRRSKDITPVMWTIGLLIRTHNGMTWRTPRTWDTIINLNVKDAWSGGLDGGWTNGHSLTAFWEATRLPGRNRAYGIGELGELADGRSIVIYEWGDPSGRWPAVVLQNDGIAFIRGQQIDIGARWRAGDDLFAMADELAEGARLLEPPLT